MAKKDANQLILTVGFIIMLRLNGDRLIDHFLYKLRVVYGIDSYSDTA